MVLFMRAFFKPLIFDVPVLRVDFRLLAGLRAFALVALLRFLFMIKIFID